MQATHEVVEELLKQNNTVMSDVAQQMSSLARHLRASIPSIVDERQYLANSTQLNLTPQSHNLELITSLIATTTSAGTLTLGERSIPLPIGTTFWNGLSVLLREQDLRQITQASQGTLSLELMGRELVDKAIW